MDQATSCPLNPVSTPERDFLYNIPWKALHWVYFKLTTQFHGHLKPRIVWNVHSKGSSWTNSKTTFSYLFLCNFQSLMRFWQLCGTCKGSINKKVEWNSMHLKLNLDDVTKQQVHNKYTCTLLQMSFFLFQRCLHFA